MYFQKLMFCHIPLHLEGTEIYYNIDLRKITKMSKYNSAFEILCESKIISIVDLKMCVQF